MKAIPTMEGGLRIDAEGAGDWQLLLCIVADAMSQGAEDLATKMGGLISEEAGAEDWKEYVVPDLREAFQDELTQVGAAIEAAMFKSGGEPGPLWITPEDAFAWYSALNQARLAIEDRYHFGPEEDFDPEAMEPEDEAAWMRSGEYGLIQERLLKYVMR